MTDDEAKHVSAGKTVISADAVKVLYNYVVLNVGESLPMQWIFDRAFSIANINGHPRILEGSDIEQAILESADL